MMCIAIILLGLAGMLNAASHYIRQGAAGANNGSSWTDAWADLPSAFARSDTYWVAAGEYGRHTFNDNEDGGKYIHVIRATEAAHGPAAGWQTQYGQGEAAFLDTTGPIFLFRKGYYHIDGVTGEGVAGHGIRLHSSKNASGSQGGCTIHSEYQSVTRNLVLEHLNVQGAGSGFDIIPALTRTLYFSGDVGGLVLRYCYIHESGQQWFHMGTCLNVLVEHCYFRNAGSGDNTYHSSGFQVYGASDTMDLVFRYNTVRSMTSLGSSAMMQLGINTAYNIGGVYVYGNLFCNDTLSRGPSEMIGNAGAGGNHHHYFYNNTIANLDHTSSGIRFDNAVGGWDNVAYNNLYYNCNPLYTGIDSLGGNLQIFDNTLFADAATYDFRLMRATAIAGIPVGAPFNLDGNGVVRGGDGFRDVGAYEYVATGIPMRPADGGVRNAQPPLPNPWKPEAGYEIMNMTGKRVDWRQVTSGICLVRKNGVCGWGRVTIIK
jgi:hypothetical protein